MMSIEGDAIMFPPVGSINGDTILIFVNRVRHSWRMKMIIFRHRATKASNE